MGLRPARWQARERRRSLLLPGHSMMQQGACSTGARLKFSDATQKIETIAEPARKQAHVGGRPRRTHGSASEGRDNGGRQGFDRATRKQGPLEHPASYSNRVWSFALPATETAEIARRGCMCACTCLLGECTCILCGYCCRVSAADTCCLLWNDAMKSKAEGREKKERGAVGQLIQSIATSIAEYICHFF